MGTRRTMIVLPEETHKRLKHLAVERETSLTQVIREAVDVLFAEDAEDVHRAEVVLKTFRPGSGVSYDAYRAARPRNRRAAQ